MPTLDTLVLSWPLQRWLVAAAVAVAVSFALVLVTRWLPERLAKRAEGTATHADDTLVQVLDATRAWFVVSMGLWAGSMIVPPPGGAEAWVRNIGVIVLLVQGAVWADRLIRSVGDTWRRTHIDDQPGSVSMVGVAMFLARLVAFGVLLLLALDNVGVDITSLVAGLGVGGIAIALAVQNVLGDLFAALSILIDKPFVVGDFLVIGDTTGTVERIGVKTTRLRSLSGEEIIVGNSDLLGSRIHNLKRMEERRNVVAIGVTYDTSPDQLRLIPRLLREAVEAADPVRFDRAHFKRFGDSSLDFELVYHVLEREYEVFMDVQQTVNLGIVDAFDEYGIEVAFPTRTLHVAPTSAASPQAAADDPATSPA